MLDRRFLDVNLVVQGIADLPSGTPATGTQYIVGSEPTGAFSSAEEGQIARYNGETWQFLTPKEGGLEVINAETGELLTYDGTEWAVTARIGSDDSIIAPVLGIVATGTSLPASAATGDKFLKTDDAKLYTATAANTWNDGVATANGDRYASSTDHKIYESDGSAVTASAVPDGGIFLNKADSYVYVYDANASAFTKASADGVTETVVEYHTLTANEATAKSFTLANSIMSGKEGNILLSVCGVTQIYNVDYSASGNAISWANKELENIGLRAGDVFVVHYDKA